MEHVFRLNQFGKRQLWTREKARTIRAQLVSELEELQEGDVLVIDASDVEVFDFSFANELFGRTVIELPQSYPGRFVVVENLLKYAKENLERALEGMGLSMIERQGETLRLIGKVHPIDKQTFVAVAKRETPATAAQLSERLGVGLNAVNERLSKLVGLGLVRRETSTSPAGREQYEYSVLA